MPSPKGFTPRVEIISGEVQGYGGPGYHWTKGVYDNRRLFKVKNQSESAAAISGERARVKWMRRWPSRAAFLAAIRNKPLDTPLCSNCEKPGATLSCLDKLWCPRPECERALADARTEYEENEKRRKADDKIRHEQETKERLRKAGEAATGFHWRDGWYFKRQPDGSVRIVHRETPTSPSLSTDLVIPPAEWASIVCSVSALGETSDRWHEAQLFHGLVAALAGAA